jgi:hypothetical protein
MKKGLLLKTELGGWVVAYKTPNFKTEYLRVLPDASVAFKMKHNQQIVFEMIGNIIYGMKRYMPNKSYKHHPLSKTPGGSTLRFEFKGSSTTNHPNIKYPHAYVNKILKEIEDEPVFLDKVFEDGKLLWENGKFVKG